MIGEEEKRRYMVVEGRGEGSSLKKERGTHGNV